MHKRKHLIRKKKARRMLLAYLSLVMGLMVGATVAYLIAMDVPITNIFTPSKITITVDETFENDEKTNVSIENTGNTEAYIRAAVIVTWKDSSGNVYSQMPKEGTDYTITYANGTGWDTETSDGFYYYTTPVASGSSTGILIESCSPVAANTPEGYGLSVEIIGSAIQSVPTSVVVEKWGVTLGSDGVTISK